ncbi:MAG TPA: hypothetical protein VD994_09805 [Prosthecobacter sp.]|nr:hypothetical protein [Prosthecobacter sp.]
MRRNIFYRSAVLTAALIVLTGSGFGPEGFKKRTWTKNELVSWYAEYRPTNERLKVFGYQGSDADYHYFITRPIDSFFMPRVPRAEIKIKDERPYSRSSSAPLYHYIVDPLQDFRKVPSP